MRNSCSCSSYCESVWIRNTDTYMHNMMNTRTNFSCCLISFLVFIFFVILNTKRCEAIAWRIFISMISGSFAERAPMISGFFAENDLQLKASYGSLPLYTDTQIDIMMNKSTNFSCWLIFLVFFFFVGGSVLRIHTDSQYDEQEHEFLMLTKFFWYFFFRSVKGF